MWLFLGIFTALMGVFLDAPQGFAQEKVKKKGPTQVLIKFINIFDGKNDKLATGQDVLVEANLIKRIGKVLNAGDGATVIDGGGRVLIPGLIDAHWHLSIVDSFDKLKYH